MKLYDENGYLNFKEIFNIPVPFIFIHGPRGVGKTYGALQEAKIRGEQFIYTRRTQTEADMIRTPKMFPFKKHNENNQWDVRIGGINKQVAAFYDGTDPAPIGYVTALSTIANIRSLDLSDCKTWIYDEFIPEEHVKPIKNEGQAFLNAYETFNRNRELEGQPPMKLIALANSNRLANPIYIELGLVMIADRMKKRRQNLYINKDRGIAIIDPFDSPKAEEKEETALYKLANKDSDFYKMAIENRFQDLDESKAKTQSLKEFKPVCRIGELCLYKHKSEKRFYISAHVSGNPPFFGISEIEIARFKRAFPWIVDKYIAGAVGFESYYAEALFNRYIWR